MCLKVIITVFRVQNGVRVFNVLHAFQECMIKNKLNENTNKNTTFLAFLCLHLKY